MSEAHYTFDTAVLSRSKARKHVFKGKNMRFQRGLIGFLGIMSFAALAAAPNCKTVTLDAQNPELQAAKSTLFLIQNTSTQTLWITHPTQNPGASAGYTSELNPGKWSALALKKPKFALGCVESRPGHEQAISCAQNIRVCAYAKAPQGNDGNYWLVENQTLSKLLKTIKHRLSKLKNKPNSGSKG